MDFQGTGRVRQTLGEADNLESQVGTGRQSSENTIPGLPPVQLQQHLNQDSPLQPVSIWGMELSYPMLRKSHMQTVIEMVCVNATSSRSLRKKQVVCFGNLFRMTGACWMQRNLFPEGMFWLVIRPALHQETSSESESKRNFFQFTGRPREENRRL